MSIQDKIDESIGTHVRQFARQKVSGAILSSLRDQVQADVGVRVVVLFVPEVGVVGYPLFSEDTKSVRVPKCYYCGDECRC